MGIRLSKDLKKENENEQPKAFEVQVTPGRDYNMDEIESARNRQGCSSLIIENEDKDKYPFHNSGRPGQMSISTDGSKKHCPDRVDYKRYLIDGHEPSTQSFSDPKFPGRDILIWEDGTEDKRPGQEEKINAIYKKIYQFLSEHKAEAAAINTELQGKIDTLEARIAELEAKEMSDEVSRRLALIDAKLTELEAKEVNLENFVKYEVTGDVYEYIENLILGVWQTDPNDPESAQDILLNFENIDTEELMNVELELVGENNG